MRRDDILVDLEKSCKMSIWLQKSASIQPRTRRPKFAETNLVPPNRHKFGSGLVPDPLLDRGVALLRGRFHELALVFQENFTRDADAEEVQGNRRAPRSYPFSNLF